MPIVPRAFRVRSLALLCALAVVPAFSAHAADETSADTAPAKKKKASADAEPKTDKKKKKKAATPAPDAEEAAAAPAAAPEETPPPAPTPAAAAPTAEKKAEGAFQRVDERFPRTGTPLISNKRYPMAGRLELTGNFDVSYADKYVEHLGGHFGATYHIFDSFAVEGFGGYLVGDESNIVKSVRIDGDSSKRDPQDCADGVCEPQLPDLWQTTWFAGADVQWAPIYGKISAVSEVDLNFQLYGILGASIEGIQKKLNSLGFTEPQVRGSVNYGLGLRLIPWSFAALRLELRNYTGINPNVPEHDDEAQCLDGYTLPTGAVRSCLIDFSNNAMFQVGLSFLL